LITAGLGVVVRAVLSAVNSPSISSSRAVDLAQGFHPAVAAEFDPQTVGTVSIDDAQAILEEWLLWARCPMRPLPPFTTPYGPSTIFFYHGRTNGGAVTNMTEGFTWEPASAESESNKDKLERLAEHVRKKRGLLLHLEYNFSTTGSFMKSTLSVPLHRTMSEVWSSRPEPSPSHGAFVSDVVSQVIARGVGNMHDETLDHDIAMLCPSLLSVGRPASDREPFRPLSARLELELNGRTTDEISVADAPPAVWVPQENPHLQQMLRQAHQQQQKLIQKHSLAEQDCPASVEDTGASTTRAVKQKVWNTEKLSRALTKLLRHQAEMHGLVIRPDGYAMLSSLQDLDLFIGVTREDILTVVSQDSKQRFGIMEEDGNLWIRANQGHSLACVVSEKLLQEITDPDMLPVCIHGTYEAAWESIRRDALDRMSRNSIQMAVGLPEDKEVKSGVRESAQVLIYIDVRQAMAQGIRFFRSANNVICSPGPIPPSCFAHVTRRSDGASLMQRSGSGALQ
jgi:2'-phosphotransferase